MWHGCNTESKLAGTQLPKTRSAAAMPVRWPADGLEVVMQTDEMPAWFKTALWDKFDVVPDSAS
jgi:hypothetical protein